MRLLNPYAAEPLPWLKGNLHTHTTQSDGNLSPQKTIEAYAALGYDFLMISDHDHFTPTVDLDACGMVLIPGNEITAYGPHLLHVCAHRFIGPERDRQRMIDDISADGGFSIVCHPNWAEDFNHCDQALLEKWTGYAGIEVCNGVTMRAEGYAYATDRWDRLLGAGRHVWGYATDDNHEDRDRGAAWCVVQAETRNVGRVTRALREGRFYASTGVVIERIEVDGLTVKVTTENAQCLHVYTSHGRRPARVVDSAIEFTVPEDFPYGYIRVECYGPADTRAWTQPFFLDKRD